MSHCAAPGTAEGDKLGPAKQMAARCSRQAAAGQIPAVVSAVLPAAQLPPPLPGDLAEALLCIPKRIPERLLYDREGSRLFHEVTQQPEYSLFRFERALLEAHAHDIAAHVPPGAVIVELGVGSAEKTAVLLNALLQQQCSAGGSSNTVCFVGIDCSAEALQQAASTLSPLQQKYRCSPSPLGPVQPQQGTTGGGRGSSVSCTALSSSSPQLDLQLMEADWMDGVAAVRRMHPSAQLMIMLLGTTVSCFPPREAAGFLHSLAAAAAGHRWQLLLGFDRWKDEGAMLAAYNDRAGAMEALIRNGLRHGLELAGLSPSAWDHERWVYEPVLNSELEQVEMYLRLLKRPGPVDAGIQMLAGSREQPPACISPGERVLVAISRKFTAQAIEEMARSGGMRAQASWENAGVNLTLLKPAH